MLDVNRALEGEELASVAMKQTDNKTMFIREIKLPPYTTENSKNIIIKKNQIDQGQAKIVAAQSINMAKDYGSI